MGGNAGSKECEEREESREREGEVCGGGGVSADTLTANSVSSTEDARPSQVTDVEGTCERCLQGSQESALQTGPP